MTINKETDKNLFDYNFEWIMYFEHYFPHNNYTNVVKLQQKTSKQLTRKKKKRDR